MPREILRPNTAATTDPSITYLVRSYDDNLTTIANMYEIAPQAYAKGEWYFNSDGTVDPDDRAAVWVAVMGNWPTTLSEHTGVEWISVQIGRDEDGEGTMTWMTVLTEHISAYSNWSLTEYRLFDVTGFVGTDPNLTRYVIRILYYNSTGSGLPPDLPPKYQPEGE